MRTLKEVLLEHGAAAGMDARVMIAKTGKTFRGTVYEALELAPAVGFDLTSGVLCTTVAASNTRGLPELQITVRTGS